MPHSDLLRLYLAHTDEIADLKKRVAVLEGKVASKPPTCTTPTRRITTEEKLAASATNPQVGLGGAIGNF